MARQLSDLQRRFQIALLLRNVSSEQVAQAVGMAATSLRNVINGARCADATRQRITNALQFQLWPDVLIQRGFTFPASTELSGLTQEQIAEATRDFGDAVRPGKNKVIFLRDTRVTISYESSIVLPIQRGKPLRIKSQRQPDRLEKKPGVAKR